jgi:hypothetical protein
MDLELIRYGNTPKGVFGEITILGKKYQTVEKPYINNEPFISSVPAGEYRLVPHPSKRHGKTWALVNEDLGVYQWDVPEAKRYAILIHVANRPRELEGCIGIGRELGAIGQDWAVLNSRNSINEILALLAQEEGHTLTIRWANPES